MLRFVRAFRGAAALAATLLVGAGTLAAQSPTITGRVTDAAAGRPIQGARVSLIGTSAIATTNQDGRYTIQAPSSGEVRVRANAIGYESQTKGSSLGATGATIDFVLTASVVQIDEIVTTATGEQSRLEVGTTISTIDAATVAAEQPITNVADLLNSRAPGVSVQTSGGTTGGGSRIRIRGANSLSLSNEPIYYVDGVRVSNAVGSGIGVGGQSVSRLNDFNPDDLESIEVVKGPAAASLYGPDAANGVIVIRTKRGKAGKAVWNFYTEQGFLQDRNPYPANFTGFGTLARATPIPDIPGCSISGDNLLFGGGCTFDSLSAFNVLRDPTTSPFQNGRREQYGLNVSGGNEVLRYFLSSDFENEVGVFGLPQAEIDSMLAARQVTEIPGIQRRPNAVRRINFRSNITAQVTPKLELGANIGFVNSRSRLPQNDNNILGVLGNAFGGFPQNETVQGFGLGIWGFGISPAGSFSIFQNQRVERLTSSFTANWRPTSKIVGRAAFGIDQAQQFDRQGGQAGEAPNFANFARGTRTENRQTTTQYTIDVGVTANTALSSDISSRSTVGGQLFRLTNNGSFATGNGIAAGSGTLNGAVQQLIASTNTAETSVGAFVEQQFGFKERLFISGGLRLDNSTFLDAAGGAVLLPKAQVSYVAVKDKPGFLNLVRFRGAYGQAILQPGFFSLIPSFAPTVAVAPAGNVNAITFGLVGNPALRPERSREFEAGVDATILDNRVTLQVSAYDKLSKDALIARQTAPSAGVAAAFFDNVASVENRGLEAQIDAQILRGSTTFDLTLGGNLFRNRIKELGQPTPILLGFTQQQREGFQVGSYFDFTPSGIDANGDGIYQFDETTVSDTTEFQGNFLPTRELSAFTALGFANGKIRLTSQWNYRGGHSLDNATENFRCASFVNCRGLYDVTADSVDQVRAQQSGNLFGYIENAEFLRLREVALTFSLPDNFARSFGAGRASITLAGRNLKVWTAYRGIDPETNNFGQANFSTSDFLTQPPVRYWTARVNLGF